MIMDEKIQREKLERDFKIDFLQIAQKGGPSGRVGTRGVGSSRR